MEKKRFLIEVLVLVLALGMTVVGRDNGSKDDNGGGTFTLTDIPAEYNGKYALFWGESESSDDFIFGCQRVNMSTEVFTLSQISNGRVSIPLWMETNTGSISKYSGNGTFEATVEIYDTATLITWEEELIAEISFPSSITFSNGSATKSANGAYID